MTRPATLEQALTTNKGLRNTYTLLAITLLFSGLTAVLSMALTLHHPGLLLTLAGHFGSLFAVTRLRNSPWGLLCVFALTGFMWLTLGPLLSAYMSLPNGSQITTISLAGTTIIFLALSGYALTRRKGFSFLSSFLMVGILVSFVTVSARSSSRSRRWHSVYGECSFCSSRG